MKKYISIVTIMAAIAVILTACAKNPSAQQESSNVPQTEQQNEQETQTENEKDTAKKIIEENFAENEISEYEQIDLSAYEEQAGMSLDDFVSYRFFYENDGLLIEGYFSAPVSLINEKNKSSCLIFNHGGNQNYGALDPVQTTYYSYIFHTVCVASNYRGCGESDGTDTFGGDDVHDVTHLIDICEKFNYIDFDKINMLGISRGGMMTYEALRGENRIHKAVVVSGLADSFMEYEERQDMQSVYKTLVGGTPDEIPEEYEKRSATYWADEIDTPLLIFHATGDEKVSVAQSEKMADALKAAGKNCELVTFDSNEHAQLRNEDVEKIKEWFLQ